jgi:glucose-1-phosphate cytidylyltransferase
MKVIIFCGGLGTRFGNETKNKPKPLIKILGITILERIMNIFSNYGFKNFILATGYKSKLIERYFKKKKNIRCVYTGLKTNTGGRLLKLKKFINSDENFFVTYGDGLTNQNLKKLLKFHKLKNKAGTVTVVRPAARFGLVTIKKNQLVSKFKEKAKMDSGWINGGYFVFNKKIFSFIKKNEMLEKQPIERLVKKKQLAAFIHKGIWQCMDTQKEKEILIDLIKKKKFDSK